MLMLIATVSACTSSKRKEEGVAALRNSYAPVQDMGIVISAGGINLFQYSQRVTDALLKFKNSEDGCKQAATKFSEPGKKALAAEVCRHLGVAMGSYVLAKEYFGPKYNEVYDEERDWLGHDEYARIKEGLPGLEDLSPVPSSSSGTDVPGPYSEYYSGHVYKAYYRDDLVKALWRLADRECQTAKAQIDQLDQM